MLTIKPSLVSPNFYHLLDREDIIASVWSLPLARQFSLSGEMVELLKIINSRGVLTSLIEKNIEALLARLEGKK